MARQLVGWDETRQASQRRRVTQSWWDGALAQTAWDHWGDVCGSRGLQQQKLAFKSLYKGDEAG